MDVDAPVGENHLQILPFDGSLVLETTTLLDEHTQLEVSNLIGLKPAFGEGGRVDEQEEAAHTKNDSGEALQDENPSPALIATDAVHLSNTRGQETGEGTRESTSAVEV